jgi:hypothetical protein
VFAKDKCRNPSGFGAKNYRIFDQKTIFEDNAPSLIINQSPFYYDMKQHLPAANPTWIVLFKSKAEMKTGNTSQ